MIEMDMPRIEVEENEAKSYAKIVVEPLEKGFGLTIGNCLRRILLSALPGAAVQGIRFYPDGLVKHEFSALPGVKEDVPEIILNLKTLAIQTASTDKDYVKDAPYRARKAPRSSRAATSSRTPRVESHQQGAVHLHRRRGRQDRHGSDRRQGQGVPGRGFQQEPSHRLHPRRLHLYARQKGQLQRRKHARRAEHRLRQAGHGSLDERRVLRKGDRLARRKDHAGPHRAVRKPLRFHQGMDILVKNEDDNSSRCSPWRSRTWTFPSVPTTASNARTSIPSKI